MELIRKNQEGGFLNILDNSLNNLGSGTKLAVEILDPTGITSWKDVKSDFNTLKSNKSLSNIASFAASVLASVPVVGKLGKISKIGKTLSKSSKTSDAIKTARKIARKSPNKFALRSLSRDSDIAVVKSLKKKSFGNIDPEVKDFIKRYEDLVEYEKVTGDKQIGSQFAVQTIKNILNKKGNISEKDMMTAIDQMKQISKLSESGKYIPTKVDVTPTKEIFEYLGQQNNVGPIVKRMQEFLRKYDYKMHGSKEYEKLWRQQGATQIRFGITKPKLRVDKDGNTFKTRPYYYTHGYNPNAKQYFTATDAGIELHHMDALNQQLADGIKRFYTVFPETKGLSWEDGKTILRDIIQSNRYKNQRRVIFDKSDHNFMHQALIPRSNLKEVLMDAEYGWLKP